MFLHLLVLILVVSLYVIHIDLIIFFIRLDFLRVIDIHSYIIWLIVQLFSLDILPRSFWFSSRASFGWIDHVIIIHVFAIVLSESTLVIVIKIESITTLFGKISIFVFLVRVHFMG